jgi:hypothetical protein
MPKMLNDLLELVLDPYVQPVNKMPLRQLGNRFEVLYNEKKGINKRRSFEVSVYPLPISNPCCLLPVKNKRTKVLRNASIHKINSGSSNLRLSRSKKQQGEEFSRVNVKSLTYEAETEKVL